MLKDRKTDCLQARPCIFQPGNVTGWGIEGVNCDIEKHTGALLGFLNNVLEVTRLIILTLEITILTF